MTTWSVSFRIMDRIGIFLRSFIDRREDFILSQDLTLTEHFQALASSYQSAILEQAPACYSMWEPWICLQFDQLDTVSYWEELHEQLVVPWVKTGGVLLAHGSTSHWLSQRQVLLHHWKVASCWRWNWKQSYTYLLSSSSSLSPAPGAASLSNSSLELLPSLIWSSTPS